MLTPLLTLRPRRIAPFPHFHRERSSSRHFSLHFSYYCSENPEMIEKIDHDRS